eukprot:5380831-Pyramimonas_sp.AAC.1
MVAGGKAALRALIGPECSAVGERHFLPPEPAATNPAGDPAHIVGSAPARGQEGVSRQQLSDDGQERAHQAGLRTPAADKGPPAQSVGVTAAVCRAGLASDALGTLRCTQLVRPVGVTLGLLVYSDENEQVCTTIHL